ncbi:MAG TPA: hypothetical protein VHW46_06530 [Terracidiphilus sp.]|jgi:hypothetical protein|nr:hypothetical protein [Terracidiphilus sp.]
MVITLNLPFLGAIPYCYFYGFSNRWLLAGLALWLVAGAIGKAMKLPLYKAIEVGEEAQLRALRRTLNTGNVLQAVLNSVAVVLAAVPFVR